MWWGNVSNMPTLTHLCHKSILHETGLTWGSVFMAASGLTGSGSASLPASACPLASGSTAAASTSMISTTVLSWLDVLPLPSVFESLFFADNALSCLAQTNVKIEFQCTSASFSEKCCRAQSPASEQAQVTEPYPNWI